MCGVRKIENVKDWEDFKNPSYCLIRERDESIYDSYLSNNYIIHW